MLRELTVEQLKNCCDPNMFAFESTRDLPELPGIIGQDRALRALEFGLDVSSEKGYNVYILGEEGTGKMTAIRKLLEEKAAGEPVPNDVCYVHNFAKPDAPRTLDFPPGRGSAFRKDMEELLKILQQQIPKVFESKEYEVQKAKIFESFQKKQRELFTKLEEEAQEKHFAIRKLASGLVMAPLKVNGEPLTDDEYESLDQEKKDAIEVTGKALQEQLNDTVRRVRHEERDAKDAVKQLDRDTVTGEVSQWINEIESQFKDLEAAVAYLKEVEEDVLDNLNDFRTTEDQQQQMMMQMMRGGRNETDFTRYRVNVFVDNTETKGAPVIIESNPNYLNLFGRVEQKVQYGMAFTDFTMVKAGSVHKANGGYLVVDCLDLLKNMFSYEGLKRVLKNRRIGMDDVWEQYRLISTMTMRPEPIPLDLKVVVVGNPYFYYVLYNLDEEFRQLFKVKADFDGRMQRNEETLMKYASFVANRCEMEGLRPFDRTGVAKIVEYGTRLSEHQEKLSARFGVVADLLREADYWAGRDQSELVRAEHVEKAREERVYRNSRIEDVLREATLEDTFIIETTGTKVGQINGLAVLGTGDYMFGKPSRITCRVYAGKAGVVNIERETKMSGKVHEKAIMILSSYLGGRYAHKNPISLSASIGFEQLYEGIEGDSATCAELYVLLSSIGNLPLRQDLAVTGSMDQHGEVQPIGGVNEKIEGFFDVCKARGFDGTHGVVIPARNVRNLMLKDEVLDAVMSGRFHIYAIDRAEEGMEIFTGMKAGTPDEQGNYAEDTFNYAVMKRLKALAEVHKAKTRKKGNGESDATNNDNDEAKPDSGKG